MLTSRTVVLYLQKLSEEERHTHNHTKLSLDLRLGHGDTS